MSQPAQAQARMTLSFCAQNLASRDELLLKSIVRLLSHRSRHTWLYVPYATGKQADLVISGELAPAVVGLSQRGVQQQLLLLGAVNLADYPSYLCMPLRADELEHELNLLGDRILLCQATPPIPNQAEASPPAPLSDATAAQPSLRDSQLALAPLTLLRWPAADLITSRERLRMATMMISQPLTLNALAQRAGLDPAVCRAFVSDLSRAGFLRASSADAQNSASSIPAERKPVVAIQLGLFARIRSRLGLQRLGY